MSYTEKLIDAMSQLPINDDQITLRSSLAQHDTDTSAQGLVKKLDDNNIEKIAIFSRKGQQPNKVNSVKMLRDMIPERIILGTSKRFDQRKDLTPEYFQNLLHEIDNDGCEFLGELMLSHADKHDGEENESYERHVCASSANVCRLLDEISKNPLPVMFHWEVYHWNRDIEHITYMLGSYPNIPFVWPHSGFGSPEQVDYILSRFSNVYALLSKREMIRVGDLWVSHTGDDLGGYNIVNQEFLNRVDCGMVDRQGIIKSDWVQLLERYPDRFMWGTDAHKPLRWKSYDRIVRVWRDILSQLDFDLAQKISYYNAKRLYKI
jgi:predicted TIM-barrel fold metal-dependent hydrolase